jgi:hypothetical protein
LGLIILSSIVSFGVILAISIIWFVFISPTFNIDSGENFAQTVTNIVCDESGGNNVASCANCLVKYLSQCYGEGQMVSGTKIKNKGISCIISKVISSQSAAAIEASAVGYNWLQCVVARASAICAGESGTSLLQVIFEIKPQATNLSQVDNGVRLASLVF